VAVSAEQVFDPIARRRIEVRGSRLCHLVHGTPPLRTP
jgi:hypothetical protein